MTNAQAQNRTLDHQEIAARIPHQGSMCLLDRVIDWDEQKIECSAISHQAMDNPLRRNNRLGAAIGIEYAAQAMAVHGALLAARETAPKKGMITR
ncbi:MAG: 3-hydroxylacyl-ACP dehydratase, partial [Halothiobacillus sp.]|nr:3-hydroxylacyl-ACP dehydratase [Halothiobacillus sp.]